MVSSVNQYHHHNHSSGNANCDVCKEEANFAQLQRKLKEMSAAIKEQKAQTEKADIFVSAKNGNSRNRFGKQSASILENRVVVMATVGVFAVTAVTIAAMIMQTSDATSKLNDVVSGRYQTVDNNIKIDIANGVSQITGAGVVPTTMPVKNWHGQWSDELDLLNGKYDNSTWVKIVPQGFETETGTVIYSNSSPEMAVVSEMNKVKDEAGRVFTQLHAYPQSVNELSSRCMQNKTFIVPVVTNPNVSILSMPLASTLKGGVAAQITGFVPVRFTAARARVGTGLVLLGIVVLPPDFQVDGGVQSGVTPMNVGLVL